MTESTTSDIGRARMPRYKRVLVGLFAGLLALCTLAALGELGVRATYFFVFKLTEQAPLIYERVYWAVPPWVARTSVMYDDPELGLWMKPNAKRTYVNLFGPIGSLADVGELFESLLPELPEWARKRPLWHLATNSSGLRGAEIPADKAPDTFRIVVMGDSWTVGINVEEGLTYPSQLGDRLSRAIERGRVEVINYGVIGGASETGVRLLRRVLALSPDLVVVAYAQNDEAEARDNRPKPRRPIGNIPRRPLSWTALAQESELYRLYRWWRTPKEDRIASTLQRELTRRFLPPSNSPGRLCLNEDLENTRYSGGLRRIVQELRAANISVVLLYNNVPNFVTHCTGFAMQKIARENGLAMVDSSVVLEHEEAVAESGREQRLELVPRAEDLRRNGRSGIDAVFRVDMSAEPQGAPVYVVGNADQLGGFVPNSVPLYDDATHGDQVAGDGVWSRRFHFDSPQLLTYLFSSGGKTGEWAGLENYRLRSYALRDTDLGRVVYLPIEQFGVHDLRSDSSHPDAAGYGAIAEVLAEVIRGAPVFQAFAQGHSSEKQPTDGAPTRSPGQ